MMALFHRAADRRYSDIPAPSTSVDLDQEGPSSIVAAEGTPTVTKSVPTPTVTISPSATPTQSPPSKSGGHLSPGQIAAIAVPIALVVLVPMIFLLYRSHQYRKATERRQSKRSSQEAMLQRQSSIARTSTSQAGALQQLAARSASSTSAPPKPRPTNSLGLFNFDISPAQTPEMSAPASPKSLGRLSVAHMMPVRRSQASIIHGKRPSTIRSTADTRDSQPSMLLDPPLRHYEPPSPANPHFAPLNQIGIAQTRDVARPSLYRNTSSYDTHRQSRQSRHSADQLQSLDTAMQSRWRAPSPGLLPQIPQGGLNLSSRFSSTNYPKIKSQRPLSNSTKSERRIPVPRIQRQESHSSWHSDVSSLSDDEHNRRARHSNGVISPFKDNEGVQPYRIL